MVVVACCARPAGWREADVGVVCSERREFWREDVGRWRSVVFSAGVLVLGTVASNRERLADSSGVPYDRSPN